MTAIASAEVIAELETAVSTGSPERRVLMLWRVTHLFLSSADRLNEYQIGVFDDVLVRLIQRIDAPSLVQLSSTLTELTLCPNRPYVTSLATRRLQLPRLFFSELTQFPKANSLRSRAVSADNISLQSPAGQSLMKRLRMSC
jgi:hypothetical protein